MYKFSIKLLHFFTLLLFFNSLYSQTNEKPDCYSIIVGKNASIDNSVFLAHNEDDYGEYIFNFYKVPATSHEKGEKIKTNTDLILDQVEKTYQYMWIDMPEQEFSDSYMNEFGVTIASDQCLSREDSPEIVDGGIGYFLRKLMAERAKNAKEAVKIAGKLIEKYGYNSSGRSYSIADPNEAWMLAAVNGKHWVAQRIPADHVAVISNCYTIGEINLKDTLNFLGSKDIIEYAVKKAWFDPKSGKKFNFKNAYARENSIDSDGNKPRQLAAINFMSEKHYTLNDDLPFSFKPKDKIPKERLMWILANHFEFTEMRNQDEIANDPHEFKYSTICSSGNQYGFIAQLRGDYPLPIANLLWIALKRPCIQPYMPVYFGISSFPSQFSQNNYLDALNKHFDKIPRRESMSSSAFWKYFDLTNTIDKNSKELSGFFKIYKQKVENKYLRNQKIFEDNYISLHNVNTKTAQDYLDTYVRELLMDNFKTTSYMFEITK
jgi:dipeptidase